MASHVDILGDLKDDFNEYVHVILGTYSFDPDFFEFKILPIFRYNEVENILVLTDKREYQEKLLTMERAGHDYYIDHCYASKTFHPKFVLLVGPERVKLILGSANLTKSGWFESGEIIGSVTHDFSEHDTDSEKILSDFRDFLSKIIERNYIKSKKHRSKLSKVIENLPASHADKKLNVHLIHNIERPILEQVVEIVNAPIKSVKILAPFFDVKGSVFDFFIKNGCKKFHVFLQHDNVTRFPKDKIKDMRADGCEIELCNITFKKNEDRFIHAKIIIIETTLKSYCLYGSANPTSSGMLSTPKNGNLELCVLDTSTPNHYYTLVENDQTIIEHISVEQIHDTPKPPNTKLELNAITIHDAYLDKKKLVLETDTLPGSANIVLSHVDEESCIIPVNTQEELFAVNLDDEQFVFCSEPTYVQIRLRKNQDESNRRWISTQRLETIPRRVDVEKILNGDGISGLLLYLNKHKKFEDDPQWFYHFLSLLRFDDLANLETGRRRAVQRKRKTEIDGTYEKPPEINPKVIFKRKFEKISNDIEESLQDMNKFEQKKFENLFELFLRCGLLNFWFTYEKIIPIEHLRFIRVGIEKFLDLFEYIPKDKNFEKCLNDINFWQHFLLLSFLMYTLQKKAGFLRTNPRVLKVFKETTAQLVNEIENDVIFVKEDFNSAMKEYSEFENLDIDLAKMDQFYMDEFSKKIF